MSRTLYITHFTDPTCPFAYSAEPTRLRLQWLYGDQLVWDTKMIVLSGYNDEISPMTPERISSSRSTLRDQYGMPMETTELSRVPQSLLACKAYIAVSLHAADKAAAFLRYLRIATMSNEYIDEQSVINTIAQKSDIVPSDLEQWIQDTATSKHLEQDVEAARNPGLAARNMSYKLSKTSTDITRYSASSYIFSADQHSIPLFELPGFWPLEAYEAAIGNLLPNVQRNDNPASIKEILRWAKTPLATQEIAVLCEQDTMTIRPELEKIARFQPIGQDGFWLLK